MEKSSHWKTRVAHVVEYTSMDFENELTRALCKIRVSHSPNMRVVGIKHSVSINGETACYSALIIYRTKAFSMVNGKKVKVDKPPTKA